MTFFYLTTYISAIAIVDLITPYSPIVFPSNTSLLYDCLAKTKLVFIALFIFLFTSKLKSEK